jgi:hypothetical protein
MTGPLLPDRHHPRREIEIINLASQHLATPRSGVGAENEHRINEEVGRPIAHECQHVLDLGQGQEQAIPERLLPSLVDAAARELPFDLSPGLEQPLALALALVPNNQRGIGVALG